MAETIAALTAYRDHFKAAGRMLEARVVEHCIQAIVRRIG